MTNKGGFMLRFLVSSVLVLLIIVPPGVQFQQAIDVRAATHSWFASCALLVAPFLFLRRTMSNLRVSFWFVVCAFCVSYGMAPWTVTAIRVEYASSNAIWLAIGLFAAWGFPNIRSALYCLLAAASVQALIVLAGSAFGLGTTFSADVLRSGGSFESANDAYRVLAICLAAGVPLLFASAYNWSLVICNFLIGAGCIATWSRNAWLGAIAAIPVTLVVLRARVRTIVVMGVILLSIATMNVAVRNHDDRAIVSTRHSDMSRPESWRAAWEKFESRPITGWGIESLELNVKIWEHGKPARGTIMEAKNQVLFHLAELGVIGGVLIVALYVLGASVCYVDTSVESMTIFAMWLAAAAMSMMDCLFFTYGGYASTALLGLMMGLTLRVGSDRSLRETSDDGSKVGKPVR